MIIGTLLLTFLTNRALGIFNGWTEDRIKRWWKETPSEFALSETARSFGAYSGLDATLSDWGARPEVLAVLASLAQGRAPVLSDAEALIQAFTDAGFEAAPGEATGDKVLATFFRHFDQSLLSSEGMVYTGVRITRDLTQVTRDVGIDLGQQIAELRADLTESRRPLLPPADLGLIPGESARERDHPEPLQVAKTLLGEGKATAALETLRVYERSLGDSATKPVMYELLAMRANALVLLSRFPEAEEDYRAALRLQPDRANAIANVGLARLHQDDVSGALALAQQAVAKEPGNVAALKLRGQALAQDGRLEEARAVFETLPASAEREFLLGQVALHSNDFTGARTHLAEAHRLSPSNPVMTRILARAFLMSAQEDISEQGLAPRGPLPAPVQATMAVATSRERTAIS